jgi:hypothetical protein
MYKHLRDLFKWQNYNYYLIILQNYELVGFKSPFAFSFGSSM